MCDITEVLPLAVKWLGVADPNFPEGGTVAGGSPYTLTQIKKLIFSCDYEIALMIVNNLEHPFRPNYVTEDTAYLADGDLITAHLGHHSQVTLKNGATYVLGKQRPFERIKLIKENPAIYGSPNNLYAIHGGRFYFADATTLGKMDVPSVVYDETFTTMNCPRVYQWAVIAMVIVKAGMEGFNPNHRTYWASVAQMYVNEITAGKVSLPEPEQLERLGT
jgi:hypothetical protein